MPAPEAIPDLPRLIVTALDIEPEWIVEESDGVGFVAGEVGVWLAVRDTPAWKSVLRIEARLARQVADGPAAREFCDYLNRQPQLGSLGGRWVHDPAAGVLALVADLPSFNEAGTSAGYVELYARFVALLADRPEIATFNSLPQREPGAGKALTLIAGQRRCDLHKIQHLMPEISRSGQDPAPVRAVVDLLEESLPGLLPARVGGHWFFSNWESGLYLLSDEGTALTLDMVPNPPLGWGILIGAGFANDAVEHEPRTQDADPAPSLLTADPDTWATLNQEASARGGVAPGCWTRGQDGETTHRLFLPAGPGEYSIDVIDEGAWGNATYMETLSFSLSANAGSGTGTGQDARTIEAATAELDEHGYVPVSRWRGSKDCFSVEVGITDWKMDGLQDELYPE